MICKISKNIYISGMGEVDEIAKLKELGINAILNVAYEVTDSIREPGDFMMVKIGLMDSPGNPDFMKSLAVIALSDMLHAGRTVLVHCAHGASRSPYIVFRYLAETEHRAIEAVYAEFLPIYPHMFLSPLNYNV